MLIPVLTECSYLDSYLFFPCCQSPELPRRLQRDEANDVETRKMSTSLLEFTLWASGTEDLHWMQQEHRGTTTGMCRISADN